MPRRFTPTDLATITLYDYGRMSPADQAAYDRALWAHWDANEARYLAGDYRKVDSRRSYELGE